MVRRASPIPHAIDRSDVGMWHPAGRLRLAVKTLEQVRILSYAFDDGLECYQSIDNGIARAVDNAHSSATQLLNEFVFAELIHRAGTSPRGSKSSARSPSESSSNRRRGGS